MNPEREERAMDNIHGRPVGPDGEELFDEMYPVASSMECTGLIPAAPAAPAEVDSYSDIYDIPLAKNAKDANHHLQNVTAADTPTPKQKHKTKKGR